MSNDMQMIWFWSESGKGHSAGKSPEALEREEAGRDVDALIKSAVNGDLIAEGRLRAFANAHYQPGDNLYNVAHRVQRLLDRIDERRNPPPSGNPRQRTSEPLRPRFEPDNPNRLP